MKRKQSFPKRYVSKRTKFIVRDNPPVVTSRDVARIARSVVRGQAETKELVIYSSLAPTDNTLSVVNLVSTTQGVTDATVVGEKVYLDRVVIRHFMYNNNSTNSSKQVRLIVFMAGEEITGTSQNNVTTSTVFKTAVGGSVLPINPTDGNKVTVLRDVVVKLQPTLTNFTVTNLETREYSYTVNLKKMFQYKDSACTYGDKSTLYLGIVGYESAAATQPVAIQTFTSLFYKDI